MLKNIIYISSGILVFFFGMLLYGLVLNLRADSLDKKMNTEKIKQLKNISVVINRTKYRLTVYSDNKEIISYKAVFGKNRKRKQTANDFATPVGTYFICNIDTSKRFYRMLKLSYPNTEDAADALKNGIISRNEFLTLSSSNDEGGCKTSETVLGAEIGIHGSGKFDFVFRNLPFVFNWTNGSVAISNKHIDELLKIVRIGTKVEIIY